MTAIIILNIVFAAFVVGGILAILSRGIVKDRAMATTLAVQRSRLRAKPVRPVRRPSAAGGSLQQVVELR